MDFARKLSAGLSYQDFLATHGNDEQRRRWSDFRGLLALTAEQQALLASFTREMPVVCLAGAWCGDCVNQCPMFDLFASATDTIKLHFFDRDTHPDLAGELKICGGARVPVVVFLSEDGFEVGRYGDRTLAKYRSVVASQAGAACPTGIGSPEAVLVKSVVQDWLDEFERAQWVLRTSARLRTKHGD